MSTPNLFILLILLALINSLISAAGVKKFLSFRTVIGSSTDLESFKEMVRKQMYQALAQIGLLGIANIVGIYGLLTRRINLLLIIALNAVPIILSKSFKKFEEQARTLEVTDANLTGQYESICKTWVKKALPDF